MSRTSPVNLSNGEMNPEHLRVLSHSPTASPSSPASPSRGRLTLPSQVQYELVRLPESCLARPQVLGAGRFAKVYAAHQLIAGLPSRRVAIKVLHDHAGYHDERLFGQEIALNRDFSLHPTPGIAPIIDIIHLGPLVLCGCGVLYHPKCPRGCGKPLERRNLDARPCPALNCPTCGYSLSAEYVHERGHELYSSAAKPCCKGDDSAHANKGTIINFVLREVMVMEQLEVSLESFAAALDRPEPIGPARTDTDANDTDAVDLERTRQQVRLLTRVYLMVQIAETVVALHGRKRVVHKDLAPDNIMIRRVPETAPPLPGATPQATLLDLAANLHLEISVIDFGLSDKEKLTRSWYEDAEANLAVTKLPFLSPEARYQRQIIGTMLTFEPKAKRFRVPSSLVQSPASIFAHDIIANGYDPQHLQDLEIERVEVEGDAHYAYFTGTPPTEGARLEIVRPLGEAHDVYALGALLYYILTGRHHEVEQLSHFVASLQDQPCEMERAALTRRNNYENRCNSIREPFWRHELMLVIIRAMVRGRPESFVKDRTVRGSDPAEAFLRELKAVQHGLLSDIFAARGRASAAPWTTWTPPRRLPSPSGLPIPRGPRPRLLLAACVGLLSLLFVYKACAPSTDEPVVDTTDDDSASPSIIRSALDRAAPAKQDPAPT